MPASHAPEIILAMRLAYHLKIFVTFHQGRFEWLDTEGGEPRARPAQTPSRG